MVRRGGMVRKVGWRWEGRDSEEGGRVGMERGRWEGGEGRGVMQACQSERRRLDVRDI